MLVAAWVFGEMAWTLSTFYLRLRPWPIRTVPQTRRSSGFRLAGPGGPLLASSRCVAELGVGLGQSCARRAPKFRCVIAFFLAQILRLPVCARKFRLRSQIKRLLRNKNETSKVFSNYLPVSSLSTSRPLGQSLRHMLVKQDGCSAHTRAWKTNKQCNK